MASHFSRAWAIASFLLAACAAHSEEPHGTYRGPDNDTPPATTAAKPEADAQDDEPTGKSLYQRHCAGCHNANGDGRGATMLAQGKQARSFAQGGFAFGNTPEAIFKTITSGIPGSSLMQGFKSQMDDDERMLVAKYVLTLTPYKEESKSSDSVMVVGDRAVFAYGKLPSIHEGGAEFPRGLMVGLPGGLSFEYRVDDVRLLAVRRGGFVDRTDWNERGGGYLKPVGEIVEECDGGEAKPWVFGHVDGHPTPLELDLVSARTSAADPGDAELELATRRSGAAGQLGLLLTLRSVEREGNVGWSRTVAWKNGAGGFDLGVVLASWPPDAEFVAGAPPGAPLPQEGTRVPMPTESSWVIVKSGAEFQAVGFLPSATHPEWQFMEGRWCVVQSTAPEGGMHVIGPVLSLRLKHWSPEELREWSKIRPRPIK